MQIIPHLIYTRSPPTSETHKRATSDRCTENKDYAEKDIDGELRRLAHGTWMRWNTGGIIQGAREWAIRPIIRVMYEVKDGKDTPIIWENGTIVYIRKTKAHEKNAVNTIRYE